MSNNHSEPRDISPFLEGIARNFDFAGSLDNPISLYEGSEDPIDKDWRAVGSDYQNSIAIMENELNGNKKSNKKK